MWKFENKCLNELTFGINYYQQIGKGGAEADEDSGKKIEMRSRQTSLNEEKNKYHR